MPNLIPRVSETALIDGCLRLLRLWGCFVWRQNTGGTRYGGPGEAPRYVQFGQRGVSDILGWTAQGFGVAVECKRPGGRIRPGQQEFVDELARRGGFGCIVHSIDELEMFWGFYTKFGRVSADARSQD